MPLFLLFAFLFPFSCHYPFYLLWVLALPSRRCGKWSLFDGVGINPSFSGLVFGPSFLWFGPPGVNPPFLLFVEVRHSFQGREVGPSWGCPLVLPSWVGAVLLTVGLPLASRVGALLFGGLKVGGWPVLLGVVFGPSFLWLEWAFLSPGGTWLFFLGWEVGSCWSWGWPCLLGLCGHFRKKKKKQN